MRVPLLSGTQLVIVDAPDDAVVLMPPEPAGQAITDVGAAVRDAVRFPLSGAPLAGIVPRGGRATIVTDVPALPLPSAPVDARRAAIGAAVQEPADLMVNVAVVEANRGEFQRQMVGHAGLRAQTVSIATARCSADDRSTASIRWCTRSASRPVTRGLRP